MLCQKKGLESECLVKKGLKMPHAKGFACGCLVEKDLLMDVNDGAWQFWH